MKTSVNLLLVLILVVTILLSAQAPPVPPAEGDKLPTAEIAPDSGTKFDILQQQLPPAPDIKRRQEIRRYLQQALNAYAQVLAQQYGKKTNLSSQEMRPQDKQKIQSYLDQALAHYEKILAGNDSQKQVATMSPDKDAAQEKSLQPIVAISHPTSLPPESKGRNIGKYVGEALANYAKSTTKSAASQRQLDQQKQEKIRQYLDQALRNYEDILQGQKKDAMPHESKTATALDLDAEKQRKIRQYLDQALQNYEEILRQQRHRQQQKK